MALTNVNANFNPNGFNWGMPKALQFGNMGGSLMSGAQSLAPSITTVPGVGDTSGGGASSGGLFSRFLDSKDGPGWGGTALSAISGLGGAYMNMKNYGLQKDALNFSRDSFNKNYEAQKTTTNASLEDRQRARVASNANAYESVGDYMNKNRVN